MRKPKVEAPGWTAPEIKILQSALTECIDVSGSWTPFKGRGNGPIAAFVHALISAGAAKFEVANYREQSLSSGTEASALAFIQIKLADGRTKWGAGVDTNVELAAIKAVLSAVNRAE